jgi:hypothetical protein
MLRRSDPVDRLFSGLIAVGLVLWFILGMTGLVYLLSRAAGFLSG